MTVYELNKDELNELKENYACVQANFKDLSYGELLEAHNIDDSIIFEEYEGIEFSKDDFFCNC